METFITAGLKKTSNIINNNKNYFKEAEMRKDESVICAPRIKFIYFAVITCNLIPLAGSLLGTWTSPVIPKLNNVSRIEENPLGEIITSEEESWLGSLSSLGAIFGTLPYGYLTDRIGRKKTILAIAGPTVLCSIILAFAKSIYLYYFARFLGGFASAGIFTTIPVYLGEISENSNRGMLMSSMSCFVAVGILLSYSVGPYVSIMIYSLFGAIFASIFFVFFLVFVPESPYYLLAKGDHEQAEVSLIKLRSQSRNTIQRELDLIKHNIQKTEKASLKDIFKSKGLIKALIISLSLMIFQQFTGFNVVLIYSQSIFEATGSRIPATISSIIIGAVQLGASFITPTVVDSLGRRVLLVTSATGMFIAETFLGLFFYLKDSTEIDVEPVFWLPVSSLVVFIFSYNIGFGSIPWALLGELFPQNVKAGASVATVYTCWILSFLISKFFNSLVEAVGMGGTFWIFAGVCAIAVVFVITYVPETKGKSFQEIQDQLES